MDSSWKLSAQNCSPCWYWSNYNRFDYIWFLEDFQWMFWKIFCLGLIFYSSGITWGDKPYICGLLGITSVVTSGLYTVSWQFDPCCQYQVETDTSKLPHVELLALLGPSSPTFLVRKDDRRRRMLHNTISVIAFSISAWRIYQAIKWKLEHWKQI